jgi:hypothetical protein
MMSMTENSTPRDLDWVRERGACTAERVFADLVRDIAKDAATRNSMGTDTAFASDLTTDKSTLIVAETGAWARKEKIKVFPSKGRIEVRDEITPAAFGAEVFLTDDGRCKLKLGDIELEQWQFRRKILESLFFGGRL